MRPTPRGRSPSSFGIALRVRDARTLMWFGVGAVGPLALLGWGHGWWLAAGVILPAGAAVWGVLRLVSLTMGRGSRARSDGADVGES